MGRQLTSQNSTKLHQRCFMKVFWNSCTKKFGKHSEKLVCRRSLQEYSLQTTTGLKTPLQIHFWRCSEEKRSFNILQNTNKLSKTVPFSLTIQAYSPEFPTQQKDSPRKHFCVSILRQLETCHEKVGLWLKHCMLI